MNHKRRTVFISRQGVYESSRPSSHACGLGKNVPMLPLMVMVARSRGSDFILQNGTGRDSHKGAYPALVAYQQRQANLSMAAHENAPFTLPLTGSAGFAISPTNGKPLFGSPLVLTSKQFAKPVLLLF
ncbi:hypothetical protein [Enterocloster clostridioformis]|uniref:hypothetical protein n=1 Tax=Enterocloster clostridioformis TaxID=1531 RepID=UPI0022E86925|nr:hypothetical protein [Enterocloster clostridioformis]